MTFPVLVVPRNGEFFAQLLGAPHISAVAETRDDALVALQGQIDRRVQAGELLHLDTGHVSLSELAGSFADDPTIVDIGREAYRLRDAE
jgi:hypothetical protein